MVPNVLMCDCCDVYCCGIAESVEMLSYHFYTSYRGNVIANLSSLLHVCTCIIYLTLWHWCKHYKATFTKVHNLVVLSCYRWSTGYMLLTSPLIIIVTTIPNISYLELEHPFYWLNDAAFFVPQIQLVQHQWTLLWDQAQTLSCFTKPTQRHTVTV